MEKRVERNKKLYEEVNKEISKRAKAHSNEAFKETNATLKAINPALFGGEKKETSTTLKESKLSKKTKITLIIFISLVLLVIGIVVGVYYGTK